MKLNGISCLSYGTNSCGAWYEIPIDAYDASVLNPWQLILTDDAGQYITSSTESSPAVSITETVAGTLILQTFGGHFLYTSANASEPSADEILDTLLDRKSVV